MKAFYCENNGYDAIAIPETNQLWVNPSAKDLELFTSSSPNFPDWEGSYEETLENVEPNLVSFRKYWQETVIAENDDEGKLVVHDQEAWERRAGSMGVTLPESL